MELIRIPSCILSYLYHSCGFVPHTQMRPNWWAGEAFDRKGFAHYTTKLLNVLSLSCKTLINSFEIQKHSSRIDALESIQESSTPQIKFLKFDLNMNNLVVGRFFTSQTVSITYEYSWEHIQSEKLCFPFGSVFVQAVFPGFTVINVRKVFSVRLFTHNVNTEENETSVRTVWRNYRLFVGKYGIFLQFWREAKTPNDFLQVYFSGIAV